MRILNLIHVLLLVALLGGVASGVEASWTGRPQERRLAELWCIAKPNLADTAYQGALDWVCGPLSGQGQVNCSPILDGQSCYLPNTVQSHASWAMNAYYQKQGQASQSCDFQGTAVLTTTNPSTTTCTYTTPNGTGSSGNAGNYLTYSKPLSYGSALVYAIVCYLWTCNIHFIQVGLILRALISALPQSTCKR